MRFTKHPWERKKSEVYKVPIGEKEKQGLQSTHGRERKVRFTKYPWEIKKSEA